jgi:hypothetical protein
VIYSGATVGHLRLQHMSKAYHHTHSFLDMGALALGGFAEADLEVGPVCVCARARLYVCTFVFVYACLFVCVCVCVTLEGQAREANFEDSLQAGVTLLQIDQVDLESAMQPLLDRVITERGMPLFVDL